MQQDCCRMLYFRDKDLIVFISIMSSDSPVADNMNHIFDWLQIENQALEDVD